jgi:TPR repeat protein
MELFNKSGALLSAVLVAVGSLIACQAQEDAIPTPEVIEAAALNMGPQTQTAAEARLREWAEQGSPVAQRELALRYLAVPARRVEARHLFESAARAGDTQAALGLVHMHGDASALDGAAAIAPVRLIKEAANSNFTLH